jgi:hypothetical protein
MAISGLGSGQLITDTAIGSATSAGNFVLKSGQTSTATGKIMTKAELVTKHHLKSTLLSGYTDTQCPPHEAVESRATAWRPINASCLVEGSVDLTAFDFLVIRYKWSSGSGSDLDTFTGIVNSGIPLLDNDWLGYAQGMVQVPGGAAMADSYLYWGGDDTNTVAGVESILVSVSKLMLDYPSMPSVMIKLNAVWYASRSSGNIDVEIKTYSGGTMYKSGLEFINSGGTAVQTLNFSKNISTQSTSGDISQSTLVGYITYTKSATSGKVTITY